VASLDFERPLRDLHRRIAALRAVALAGTRDDDGLAAEIERLEARAQQLQRDLFDELGAWDKVQLSRHPERPYTLDYIARMVEGFVALHGDRLYGDDAAIVGGLGRLRGRAVVLLGHQKGRGVKESVRRNFGMPHPEGYRKARRLIAMAERFRRPLVTLIDTPGAYPGLGAEERGQSEAIGQCILALSQATVPVVAAIVGEGGSGGALALAVANRVVMLQYATYSVISPEGCASILWKDGQRAPEAAEALKLTAEHLYRFGVVDELVVEPDGGAHRDPDEAARRLGDCLVQHLDALAHTDGATLAEDRYKRFRALGEYLDPGDAKGALE
jgi:acetyl-CoA carboxylase carboxyl transferase subunit alpha